MSHLYTRTITPSIHRDMFGGKAIIIYGARQVGKTTLCRHILDQYSHTYYLTGDDPYTHQLLRDKSIDDYRRLFGQYRVLCIDEAQNIPDIGSILKLLIDHLPDLQLIATGSSSFELANHVNEPLTGRVSLYHLYPLSATEIADAYGPLTLDAALHTRLIYGMYPASVSSNDERTLLTLAESYVYKDVFALQMIKKSDSLIKLLQALAYQIGNQVSYNELAQLVGIDPKTVQAYIRVLEHAFIIFRLPSFAKNLRNELKKTQKIFFWDTGIRNSLIRRFGPLDMRDDVGALRENFIIAEILKNDSNTHRFPFSYFWRTKSQQEIDLVQEYNSRITAYEIKRNKKKTVRRPRPFMEAYDPICHVITTDNWLEHVG